MNASRSRRVETTVIYVDFGDRVDEAPPNVRKVADKEIERCRAVVNCRVSGSSNVLQSGLTLVSSRDDEERVRRWRWLNAKYRARRETLVKGNNM